VHIKRSGQKSSVYYAPESQDIPLWLMADFRIPGQ
jgi:hypothetical protein